MSDGHLSSPGNNPQSNLPPLTGFESGTPATRSAVSYPETPGSNTYPATQGPPPQGTGASFDLDGPQPKRSNLPRILGLLALAVLIGFLAWFLLTRGDDSTAVDDDATAQITPAEDASENDDADQAMADDEDAMADDSAMSDDEAMTDAEPGTVVAGLLANSDLSIVADGIGQLGIDAALEAEGPFTILAPTNDAFLLVSEDDLARLLSQEDNAATVLSYHVLQGDFSAENFVTALEAQGGSLTVDSLTGEQISVELVGDQVVLNGTSVVIDPDQPATNGVIHTISELLVPPSLADR